MTAKDYKKTQLEETDSKKYGISWYDIKLYRKINTPEDEKRTFVKEISKVLTEIEEIKKNRKIFYFSSLIKKPVVDLDDKKIGKLKDLSIIAGEKFPEVSQILVDCGKKEEVMISWKNVLFFNKIIKLNKKISEIEKRPVKEDDIFLGKHMLDKQVVDINGMKIIRVNDIALIYVKNKIDVVNIDVGNRAMLRRLGFEKIAKMLSIKLKDLPVPWSSIQPLNVSLEKIKLSVPCGDVSALHPADVAELFDELSHKERSNILKSMKKEIAAKVLLECEPDVQKAIIRTLKTKRLASILEKMPPNEAANLISEYGETYMNSLLRAMNKDASEKIRNVLTYPQGSAARYMSDTFILMNEHLTVAQTLEKIRSLQKYPDVLYYIYVQDDNGMLVGALSLKRLVISDSKKRIGEIISKKPISVESTHPVEYAEELITKYDLMTLPVTGLNGKIIGVIHAEDMLELAINREKKNQPFLLSEEQKETLEKELLFKRYYKYIMKDIGQFLKGLQRKKDRGVDNAEKSA